MRISYCSISLTWVTNRPTMWHPSLSFHPLRLPEAGRMQSSRAGAENVFKVIKAQSMCSSMVLSTAPSWPTTSLLGKAWEGTHSCTSLAVNFTRLLQREMCFPNGQGKLQFGTQLANVGMSHSWTYVLNNNLSQGGTRLLRRVRCRDLCLPPKETQTQSSKGIPMCPVQHCFNQMTIYDNHKTT